MKNRTPFMEIHSFEDITTCFAHPKFTSTIKKGSKMKCSNFSNLRLPKSGQVSAKTIKMATSDRRGLVSGGGRLGQKHGQQHNITSACLSA